MALDITLMMKPLKGESAKVKEAIDVLAWSWGVSQSGTMHSSTGGGAGQANFQDLSFTKWQDSSSCDIFQSCAVGEHFDEATLEMRKVGGKNNTEFVFFKLVMKEIIITSVSQGGSGGEDRLTENVGLNFGQYQMQYFKQDEKGAKAAAGDVKFDIAQNKTL